MSDELVSKSFQLHSLAGDNQPAQIPAPVPVPSAKPKKITKEKKKKPAAKAGKKYLKEKQTLAAEPQSESKKAFLRHEKEWFIRSLEKEDTETSQKVLGYLMKLELLDYNQVAAVHEVIKKDGVDLIQAILNKKYLKENEIGQAIASFYNTTYTSFKGAKIPAEIITLIPKSVIQKNGAVVFEEKGHTLKVAMTNPLDYHFIHLLENKTNHSAEIHFTTPGQINEALKSYPSEFEFRFEHLLAKAGEAISHLENLNSISQVFDSLVLMAYQRNASDVHIEPLENEIRVRFRIDGVLHVITVLPRHFLETIINHIKVLAKLRIDTHNAFQDGRFHVTYENTTINFRVSIMPSHFGEKAVLRLLTSETQEWSLSELGYQQNDQKLIHKGISKTNGMILVCGPTGSGKTTTLYAILKELNQEGVNISTIEDPIEYGLPGILQTQVNPHTNITYAEGLKSLMRQDPDILMIGEIRDFETGKIAVNSALTGHLVFSTLHTNNASLAPLRLLQMNIDPYLIVNTVNLIVAQRLLRKICHHCLTSVKATAEQMAAYKTQYGLSAEQIELFNRYFKNSEDIRLFKGTGCPKCGNTGYHGRIVIAEVLELKDNIRELILKNAGESQIQNAAQTNGMTIMLEDGLNKAIAGVTTLEEVFRVVNQ